MTPVDLPSWAMISRSRRAHSERVARLAGEWADALAVRPAERARWLRAVALHDALKDAPAETLRRLAPDAWDIPTLWHGPAAATMARQHGETDPGVLDAVHYHSVGYSGWDDAGRMLYLADYLEPGRRFRRAERRAMAARVPYDVAGVLRQVARQRLDELRRRGVRPLPETLAFCEALACDE